MSNPAYEAARQKLWNALEFEPNKRDGQLTEGDLYRVKKVVFEDDTEPSALLKRMLGKKLTFLPSQRRDVLNAILGADGVIIGLVASKPDSKFCKIKMALTNFGAWNNATCFINAMVKNQNGNREDFKLLLKEYLKKATTRTFDANGRDPYRGDRILCCLLLLHCMTKDDRKLNVEVVYYPSYLPSNKNYFIYQAQELKQICGGQRLDGVKAYFNKFSGKKLAYYDVVLPKEWNNTITSDFDRIKKVKNTFDELSNQYYDIAWGVNKVSTPEDRLKITKFFVAAIIKSDQYMVFAKQDDAILAEITDALFSKTWAAAPIRYATDKDKIQPETTQGLANSIAKLVGALFFPLVDGQKSGDHTEILQHRVRDLVGKSIHDVRGDGRTNLRLLQDYEKIIEQMKLLKSLSYQERTTFLNDHVQEARGMLDGRPLNSTLVSDLQDRNRKVNAAQITSLRQNCEATLRDKQLAARTAENQAYKTATDLKTKAEWYSYLYPRGHWDHSNNRPLPIADWIFNILCGRTRIQNHFENPTASNLINFVTNIMKFPCPTNNPNQVLQELWKYQAVRGKNRALKFTNSDINDTFNDAIKKEKKSQLLHEKLTNPNYLKPLQDLQATLANERVPYELKLKQFQNCIESYYKFDWINTTDLKYQEEILGELMYDHETGELTQMMKDLVKNAKKVKTITASELRRQTATTKPQKCDPRYCSHYVNTVLNDPLLYLHDGQRFIPGQELMERLTEVLERNGISKNDVLHVQGAASQGNLQESKTLNYTPLNKQTSDRTQGPTMNATSLIGLIKRDDMYHTGELKDCDMVKPLIEKMYTMQTLDRVDYFPSGKDIGIWVPKDEYYNHAAKIYDKTQETYNGKYAFYRNGYIQPATLNQPGEEALMDAMAAAPCSYASQENTTNDGKQEFIQNFAAAFSYQDICNNDQGTFTPIQIMMNLMWVYPQYDNVLKDAIRQSANHPKKKLVIAHMPDIGQGAFGNPPGLTGLALVLATIVNFQKLAGSNIILQRNGIDGLNPRPANDLYRILNTNYNVVSPYANKLGKNFVDALGIFNDFSHLVSERAIVFGYFQEDGR